MGGTCSAYGGEKRRIQVLVGKLEGKMYVFFWVFPRRLIKFYRRFRTLCQVHLQRLDETSAKLNLTPEKYPKENIQVSEHGENLKP
jgi:hypothetical protein